MATGVNRAIGVPPVPAQINQVELDMWLQHSLKVVNEAVTAFLALPDNPTYEQFQEFLTSSDENLQPIKTKADALAQSQEQLKAPQMTADQQRDLFAISDGITDLQKWIDEKAPVVLAPNPPQVELRDRVQQQEQGQIPPNLVPIAPQMGPPANEEANNHPPQAVEEAAAPVPVPEAEEAPKAPQEANIIVANPSPEAEAPAPNLQAQENAAAAAQPEAPRPNDPPLAPQPHVAGEAPALDPARVTLVEKVWSYIKKISLKVYQVAEGFFRFIMPCLFKKSDPQPQVQQRPGNGAMAQQVQQQPARNPNPQAQVPPPAPQQNLQPQQNQLPVGNLNPQEQVPPPALEQNQQAQPPQEAQPPAGNPNPQAQVPPPAPQQNQQPVGNPNPQEQVPPPALEQNQQAQPPQEMQPPAGNPNPQEQVPPPALQQNLQPQQNQPPVGNLNQQEQVPPPVLEQNQEAQPPQVQNDEDEMKIDEQELEGVAGIEAGEFDLGVVGVQTAIDVTGNKGVKAEVGEKAAFYGMQKMMAVTRGRQVIHNEEAVKFVDDLVEGVTQLPLEALDLVPLQMPDAPRVESPLQIRLDIRGAVGAANAINLYMRKICREHPEHSIVGFFIKTDSKNLFAIRTKDKKEPVGRLILGDLEGDAAVNKARLHISFSESDFVDALRPSLPRGAGNCKVTPYVLAQM